MARIIDVIEAPNQQKDEMVRRLPEYGSGDFRFGSQVIVREFQSAVFFRDGKSYDAFGPGRHTITTANAPLLTNLIQAATSGKTPFTAEVYFVNMREFLDEKWGTAEPVALRDADLGLVRLRAFGTYSFQVNNPSLFVNKIVGAQGIYQTAQITRFLRGIIVAKLTDLLGEMGRGLFDLPALFDEIGAGAKAKVQDDFANLGVQLKTLYVNSISPTEETAKAIDERASMGAIGDMQAYLQFQTARGIREAAQAGGEGMSGAGVGLGAGVGMGAAMAQMISQAAGGGGGQPSQAGAAPAAAGVPDIMTLSEAATYMRVGEDDVLSIINSGELKAKKIGTSYRIAKKAIDDYLAS
ncbi:MAG: excisionase family DNA-binding protein [Anaerolineaceae bacterium]|jgi:excisionase family DNA binding protein|nr:SPFH domain-containing protein [Anaerolineae bacterium]NLF12030.1 excisionase family DNA-binding protein [Anaerolineaceae bacterium]